jgi:hypothetical protein
MKKFLSLMILLCLGLSMKAQQKYTISGYIRDSLSQENLIGAAVAVKGQGKGVNSNVYGFYSLTLPAGTYALSFSFVGYNAQEFVVTLDGNTALNVSLFPKSSLSQEIVISSRRRDANVKNAQMGQIDLSMNRYAPYLSFLVKWIR